MGGSVATAKIETSSLLSITYSMENYSKLQWQIFFSRQCLFYCQDASSNRLGRNEV